MTLKIQQRVIGLYAELHPRSIKENNWNLYFDGKNIVSMLSTIDLGLKLSYLE